MNDDGSRGEESGNDSINCDVGSCDRLIHKGSFFDDPNTASGIAVDDGGVEEGNSSGSSVGGEIIALPTRKTRQGISRSFVELELSEHIKDLTAFKGAYSRIHARVLEVQDEGRLMKLVNWSGTSAVMGSLELSIHAIERTVEELKDLLKRLDAGAIIDSDKV